MVKIIQFAKAPLCVLIYFLFSSVMALAQYPANSPVAINGKLKVENSQLVNECGYPVQLRGMSTHGLAWNKTTYNESSIQTLVKDWKISLFRIAVYTHEWGGYTTGQWKSRDEYHTYIDDLVAICAKYGIYCIIDWHVLNNGSGDPNYTIEDARYFWEYMSKHHKDDKHVLYEICNEPNGDGVTWATVKKYADEIIPFIREIDPNTIIICGTPTWSQDVDKAAADPLDYTNIMYTLHFYSGTHKDYLRSKAMTAIRKGLALFVTEFGTSLSSGTGGVFTAECDKWMTWMDQNNISWANWSFCDVNETSAALQPGSAKEQNWNNVSESGKYIKEKLALAKSFTACTDTTPYYEPAKKGELVEEIDNSKVIKIYPNPSQDGSFSIDISEDEIEEVEILNQSGQVVEKLDTSTSNKYVTHNLKTGIYFVKIHGSKNFSVKKLVVK